jgi:hypothetical protein
MYPGGKVWDSKPDSGGPPVEIVVGNPRETVARDPERYSLHPPKGTPQADLMQRSTKEVEERAKIEAERQDRLAKIAVEREQKLDAARKERSDKEREMRQRQVEQQRKEAEERGELPPDLAETTIENEAHAAAQLVHHEFDEKLRAMNVPTGRVEVAQAAPQRPEPPSNVGVATPIGVQPDPNASRDSQVSRSAPAPTPQGKPLPSPLKRNDKDHD